MDNGPRRRLDPDQRRAIIVLAVIAVVIVVLAVVIGSLVASLGVPTWIAVLIGVGVAAALGLFMIINLI